MLSENMKGPMKRTSTILFQILWKLLQTSAKEISGAQVFVLCRLVIQLHHEFASSVTKTSALNRALFCNNHSQSRICKRWIAGNRAWTLEVG